MSSIAKSSLCFGGHALCRPRLCQTATGEWQQACEGFTQMICLKTLLPVSLIRNNYVRQNLTSYLWETKSRVSVSGIRNLWKWWVLFMKPAGETRSHLWMRARRHLYNTTEGLQLLGRVWSFLHTPVEGECSLSSLEWNLRCCDGDGVPCQRFAIRRQWLGSVLELLVLRGCRGNHRFIKWLRLEKTCKIIATLLPASGKNRIRTKRSNNTEAYVISWRDGKLN